MGGDKGQGGISRKATRCQGHGSGRCDGATCQSTGSGRGVLLTCRSSALLTHILQSANKNCELLGKVEAEDVQKSCTCTLYVPPSFSIETGCVSAVRTRVRTRGFSAHSVDRIHVEPEWRRRGGFPSGRRWDGIVRGGCVVRHSGGERAVARSCSFCGRGVGQLYSRWPGCPTCRLPSTHSLLFTGTLFLSWSSFFLFRLVCCCWPLVWRHRSVPWLVVGWFWFSKLSTSC